MPATAPIVGWLKADHNNLETLGYRDRWVARRLDLSHNGLTQLSPLSSSPFFFPRFFVSCEKGWADLNIGWGWHSPRARRAYQDVISDAEFPLYRKRVENPDEQSPPTPERRLLQLQLLRPRHA